MSGRHVQISRCRVTAANRRCGSQPIAQLRAEGFDVRPEDVARLSPLGFEHINMLGRYAFTLPNVVARGELRPLRDPTLHDDEG